MGKISTLLLLLALTISSALGYVVLTHKINQGEAQLADGRSRLAAGEKALASGKAKLASGEQQLKNGEDLHRHISSVPVLGVATVLTGGLAAVAVAGESTIVGQKIAEGKKLVNEGKMKVQNGEARLAAGKAELQEGVVRLALAHKIRVACMIAAAFFASLLLLLGMLWLREKRVKL